MNLLKIAKQIFKLMVLGFLSLFVLESSARIDDWINWNAPLFGNYSRRSLTLMDSKGFRNRPNSQFQKWVINGHGFRGKDVNIKKNEGVVRIIIIGASETFGLYEDSGKEYPAQIQSYLDNYKKNKYEVINAAVPGISPPRLKHLYENLIQELKPDIVVYYPSPTLYLLRNPPGPILNEHFNNNKQGIELRIVSKTRTVIKSFLPSWLQTKIRQLLIKRYEKKLKTHDIFYKVPAKRLDLLRTQMQDLIDSVKDSGAEMILMTHATRLNDGSSEKERQLLIGWRKLYPHVKENCFILMENEGNRVYKELALKNGIELIDAEREIPKEDLYFADHVHFTNNGAQKMAKIISDAIINRNY